MEEEEFWAEENAYMESLDDGTWEEAMTIAENERDHAERESIPIQPWPRA
jgi:hypothetical protein